MNRRLFAFIPVALAAGVVLLSACGQADIGAQAGTTVKTSQSTQVNSGKSAKTDGVVADDGEAVESTDCGTIEIHSVEQMLVADGTSDGRAGCTEAFNVIDQYLDASPVPADWTCDGVDNG